MILLFSAGLFWSLFMSVVNLLPRWTVPAGVASGGSTWSGLSNIASNAGSMSAWVDFTQVAVIVTAMGTVVGVAAVIWLTRRLIVLLPFVGKVGED